jgi:hypothetical protein
VVGAHQPESGHFRTSKPQRCMLRTIGTCSEPPIAYGFASPSTCGERQWGKAVGLGLEKAGRVGGERAGNGQWGTGSGERQWGTAVGKKAVCPNGSGEKGGVP